MSEQANNQNSPPIKTFRAGRAQAAVFENQVERDGKEVSRRSIKINKRYKDKDDKWQSTAYFYPDELGDLSLVVQEVNRFLNLRETSPQEPSPETTDQR